MKKQFTLRIDNALYFKLKEIARKKNSKTLNPIIENILTYYVDSYEELNNLENLKVATQELKSAQQNFFKIQNNYSKRMVDQTNKIVLSLNEDNNILENLVNIVSELTGENVDLDLEDTNFKKYYSNDSENKS